MLLLKCSIPIWYVMRVEAFQILFKLSTVVYLQSIVEAVVILILMYENVQFCDQCQATLRN